MAERETVRHPSAEKQRCITVSPHMCSVPWQRRREKVVVRKRRWVSTREVSIKRRVQGSSHQLGGDEDMG